METATQVSPHRIIKGPCYPSELETMKYIAKHTTIPIPKVYRSHPAPGHEGKIYIEMELIKGDTLYEAFLKGLSDKDKKTIFADLKDIIEQLRSLPPPGDGMVQSPSKSGVIRDARIGQKVVGPFKSLKAFHQGLRSGICVRDSEQIFGPTVVKVHTQNKYRILFAHADLVPRNIIVRNGRIAAVIDWAFGGWYPEYWEFTKIHYDAVPRPEWYEAVAEILPGYEEELAAERALWRRCDQPAYNVPNLTEAAHWVHDDGLVF